MGIKGLWKEISPVCRQAHLREMAGQTVGVDAYGWLHRAAVGSAAALEQQQPCDRFLQVFMGRVALVQRCGLKVVLVFDGRSMPMKANTDEGRHEKRRAAREEGRVLEAQGRVAEAAKAYERALDVSHEMAFAVLSVAKESGIRCIVAPYEADAQLAYLNRKGLIHAVISEDSDMLVYNCGTLIAKLDSHGSCDVVRLQDLPQLAEFAGMSYEAFLLVAILSGCDYVANLPGVGIKSAIKTVRAHPTIHAAIRAVATSAQLTSREQELYEGQVHRAFYAFAHHLVYDPATKSIVPINPFPAGVPHREQLLGLPPEDPVGVCEHHTIDPETGMEYTKKHSDSVARYWARVRGERQPTLREVVVGGSNDADPDASMGGGLLLATGGARPNAPFVQRRRERVADGAVAPTRQRTTTSRYWSPRSNADGLIGTRAGPAATSRPSLSPPAGPSSGTSSPLMGEEAHHGSDPQDRATGPTGGDAMTVCSIDPHDVPSPVRDIACPHGRPECREPHSLLHRCWEGSKKNRSPLADGSAELSPPPPPLTFAEEDGAGGCTMPLVQIPTPQRHTTSPLLYAAARAGDGGRSVAAEEVERSSRGEGSVEVVSPLSTPRPPPDALSNDPFSQTLADLRHRGPGSAPPASLLQHGAVRLGLRRAAVSSRSDRQGVRPLNQRTLPSCNQTATTAAAVGPKSNLCGGAVAATDTTAVSIERKEAQLQPRRPQPPPPPPSDHARLLPPTPSPPRPDEVAPPVLAGLLDGRAAFTAYVSRFASASKPAKKAGN